MTHKSQNLRSFGSAFRIGAALEKGRDFFEKPAEIDLLHRLENFFMLY